MYDMEFMVSNWETTHKVDFKKMDIRISVTRIMVSTKQKEGLGISKRGIHDSLAPGHRLFTILGTSSTCQLEWMVTKVALDALVGPHGCDATEPLQKHILDRISIQAQLQAAVVQVDTEANDLTLASWRRGLVRWYSSATWSSFHWVFSYPCRAKHLIVRNPAFLSCNHCSPFEYGITVWGKQWAA